MQMSRQEVLSVQLLERKKTLSPSKSLGTTGNRRRRTTQNLNEINEENTLEEGVRIFSVKSPCPTKYDNFKEFFDRSKHRKFTIGKGKKFAPIKSPSMPGPANYDTRSRHFAT